MIFRNTVGNKCQAHLVVYPFPGGAFQNASKTCRTVDLGKEPGFGVTIVPACFGKYAEILGYILIGVIAESIFVPAIMLCAVYIRCSWILLDGQFVIAE